MTVSPVIDRELRIQSRLGFTYLLRVLGAAMLLSVFFYFWAEMGFSQKIGGIFFGYLNCALLVSIWALVPLLSADCISCERREGTLGLLFLTPLRAREIVFSKGLVHGLRAMTLLLAVLPILTISFLIGGVSWKDAVLSALINFSSVCWALAAGLLASSASKAWLRAMTLAGLIAGFLFLIFIFVAGAAIMWAADADPAFQLPFPFLIARNQQLDWSQFILPAGFFGATDLQGWWGTLFGSLNHATQRRVLIADAALALGSVMFLLLVILIAAGNLRRVWQEGAPSVRQVRLQRMFCTPVIGVSFFRRWLRRKLERNPIGWLEQRTWTGRMVTWGWLAVTISFYSAVFYAPGGNILLTAGQEFLAWSMIGLIAVSAAGSFQRERETRVLEMLLVSPMSASSIIWGRLRGLWGQFLPTMLLMLGVWIYLAEIFRRRSTFSLIPFLWAAFLTLPVIGLYYSLKRSTFIGSFLSTVFVALFIPYILTISIDYAVASVYGIHTADLPRYRIRGSDLSSPLVRFSIMWAKFETSQFFINSIQIALALWIGRKLHRDLKQRNFPLTAATS